MATGTYKDLDACLTVAIARAGGVERLVLSSGGNLGYALARYASRIGLEVFVFQPATTLYKLDGGDYDDSRVRLIAVDLPERSVKALAESFAEHYAILHAPDFHWRIAASAVRAMFILEHALAPRTGVQHVAQTMCAGFGPVGVYECFSALATSGLVRPSEVPRFLGFQQDANCPMVRAWLEGSREIGSGHVEAHPERYLEPGLYNTNPGESYARLFQLMRTFGGDLLALSNRDYARYAPQVTRLLEQAGIELTRLDGGELIEKTGVLTGVGILKAIATGRIRRGEGVVYLLTGGRRVRAGAPRRVAPLVEVDGSRSIDEWIVEIGRQCGLVSPGRRAVVA
jgi:threonine synthase